MPLLEGLDGVNKMSKSLGNYVGITDAPNEMFGKLMSVSDVLMWRYFELLSFRSDAEIAKFKEDIAGGRNPRDIKVLLCDELVGRFHGAQAAKDALADFENRFRQGGIPDDIAELTIDTAGAGMGVGQVLKQAGLVASTSEAFRQIEGGGVRADGEKVADRALQLAAGTEVVLQVGKRKFARVKII
jgi:tyrosyl-tRNA synthetase